MEPEGLLQYPKQPAYFTLSCARGIQTTSSNPVSLRIILVAFVKQLQKSTVSRVMFSRRCVIPVVCERA